MKILIEDKTAYLPIQEYGGTERVIWGLGKELSKLGHTVYFLVKPGSTCEFATVIPFYEHEHIASKIPEDIDVVHLHHSSPVEINKPHLFTMGANPSKNYNLSINTVFVSKNHATRYGASAYVHNGLDWNDYPKPILNNKRTYLHFLAKASWKVKNVFGSAKIALKSNHELQIMGGQRWTFRNLKRGFKFLFTPKIKFCGMVDDYKKIEIAQHSKALIFPVTWHEPFGLAIIESLYAGCAVFGTPNGSLPELIIPEVGYLSTNTNELAKAIQEFEYDPKRCHDYAVTQFNSKVMTEKYIVLYEKVLNGEPLNTTPPKYIASKNSIPPFQ